MQQTMTIPRARTLDLRWREPNRPLQQALGCLKLPSLSASARYYLIICAAIEATNIVPARQLSLVASLIHVVGQLTDLYGTAASII